MSKPTLRTNLHTREKDKRMETSVLKTLAGFLNTDGGTLIIGVSDDGTPVGIVEDGFPNEDKMSLHLVNLISSRMGPQAMTSMHVHFEYHEECRVMVIRLSRSPGRSSPRTATPNGSTSKPAPRVPNFRQTIPNPTFSSGSGERVGTILPVPAGGRGGAAGGREVIALGGLARLGGHVDGDGCFDGNWKGMTWQRKISLFRKH